MDREVEELRQAYLEEMREAMMGDVSEDSAAYGPGSFGMHEALHMTSFLMSAVSDELLSHPAVANRPEWFGLAHEAFGKLYRLYQEIGAEHLEKPDEHAPTASE